jgi:hypothetical protein
MAQRNYKLKKNISMKQFIIEFGGNFSEHMKERLLNLEVRTVLTRKDDATRLDIKHVEHTQYNCDPEDSSGDGEKEYTFGQFVVVDDILYFCENCIESSTVMESSIVNKIYNNLSDDGMLFYENTNLKKIDDTNIDYVIDSILTVCPEVSDNYKTLMQDMNSRAEAKLNRTSFANS